MADWQHTKSEDYLCLTCKRRVLPAEQAEKLRLEIERLGVVLQKLLDASLDVQDAWDKEDAYRNFETAVSAARAALETPPGETKP